jgi:hypothetical protein
MNGTDPTRRMQPHARAGERVDGDKDGTRKMNTVSCGNCKKFTVPDGGQCPGCAWFTWSQPALDPAKEEKNG